MHKTIEISLSEASIDNAIREFDAFRQWIEQKTEELNERLATVGALAAANGFYSAIYDGDDADVKVSAYPVEDGWIVAANGHAVAFIEYGAGVYFNGTEPYPQTGDIVRPPEMAKIGEYGKGRGKQDWWVYIDSAGHKHFTHGNPAAMPMFYATEQIRREIDAIAKEVFAQ